MEFDERALARIISQLCEFDMSSETVVRSDLINLYFVVVYQVHYNFNKILMLQEPLLVVGAFYILFFTVIIYVRLDFAITKV